MIRAQLRDSLKNAPKIALKRRVHHALALLALLLIVGPGCQTNRARPHPEAVEELMAESPPPLEPKFEPISKEDRLEILGENGHHPYLIGIGDGLSITGDTEFLEHFGETQAGGVRPTYVKPDGNIYLPEIGAVPANGMTVVQLQDELAKLLSKYKTKPFVSVDVIEHKSQEFYVLGAVSAPGVFPVDGRVTLLSSVGLAGGVNEQADLEQAYVIRDSKILPVSLADMVARGDMSRNIHMREGDLVFVPERVDAKVYVVGEVKSAGPIPMVKGRLTLAAATAAAGGFDAVSADANQVRVYRGGWDNPRTFTLSTEDVYKYGESIQLRSGDRVMVAPTAQFSNAQAAKLVLPYITTTMSVILAAIAISR